MYSVGEVIVVFKVFKRDSLALTEDFSVWVSKFNRNSGSVDHFIAHRFLSPIGGWF